MENIRKLDCSGLVCPMPVAKTKRTLIEMNSGDILEINGDFLEAGENIKRFAEKQGHQILEFKIDGDKYY
ncbi:MAG: sulfurtransferase TusA family protein, partial [Promethearchaeota archaeon]